MVWEKVWEPLAKRETTISQAEVGACAFSRQHHGANLYLAREHHDSKTAPWSQSTSPGDRKRTHNLSPHLCATQLLVSSLLMENEAGGEDNDRDPTKSNSHPINLDLTIIWLGNAIHACSAHQHHFAIQHQWPAWSSHLPLSSHQTNPKPFVRRTRHYQFSTISLIALAGLWMTSPAAIRFTTVSSRRRITPAMSAMVSAGHGEGPVVGGIVGPSS